MPYDSVADARERVFALKELTDKQVKVFIEVFNKLETEQESSRYAQAISAAKKVDDYVGKTLMKSIRDLFEEFLSPKQKDEVHYIEKFQEEEMIAYEPLYCPPDVPDGEGEGMTESEIKKMVSNIKKKIEDGIMQANLFHKIPTKAFEWVDVFVNPWPTCKVGDQDVVKGQPVAVCKYHNKNAWELRKQGIIKGPSIEGTVGKKKEVA